MQIYEGNKTMENDKDGHFMPVVLWLYTDVKVIYKVYSTYTLI